MRRSGVRFSEAAPSPLRRAKSPKPCMKVPCVRIGGTFCTFALAEMSRMRVARRQLGTATIAIVTAKAIVWWKATRIPGLFGLRLTA